MTDITPTDEQSSVISLVKDIEQDVLYRYEDVQYSAGVDEYGNTINTDGPIRIQLYKFNIIKRTPKGVWISLNHNKRFVLNNSRKHFACATIEEAKKSFLARKKAQLRIYRARIRRAEKAIALAQGGKFDTDF